MFVGSASVIPVVLDGSRCAGLRLVDNAHAGDEEGREETGVGIEYREEHQDDDGLR